MLDCDELPHQNIYIVINRLLQLQGQPTEFGEYFTTDCLFTQRFRMASLSNCDLGHREAVASGGGFVSLVF